MPRLIMVRKKKVVSAAVTSLHSAASASSTTHTFNSVPFGTETSDRVIIVGVIIRGGGNVTISSVTVDGNAASSIADVRNSTSSNTTRAAIFAVSLPAGTTGSVVVTISASIPCGIQVWGMTGGNPTAVDSGTSVSSNPSTTVNVPDRGAVCAVSYSFNSATASWTGVTEDNLQAMSSGQLSGAHTNYATASAGQTVQCTWSSNNVPALAVAVFGPAA